MSNPTPEPATKLSADAVITHLRAMRSQIEDVSPLTAEQRRVLKQRLRSHTKVIVEASINVMGVVDNVSQAIGQPLDEVRQLQDDSLRWDAAAEEARAFLNGIEGANLIRHQRLALIGTQAYTIGGQLAKDPANSVLVPHVEEVRRLKQAASRRKKKTAQTPPATTPATPPAHDPTSTPKSVI